MGYTPIPHSGIIFVENTQKMILEPPIAGSISIIKIPYPPLSRSNHTGDFNS
jgi:hypothetical protein